jgi:DNA repair protein RAD50
MTTIDKLSIRGIRSFSPQSDETIEFYSPLTMIVGANGCGKTTIIECLKYVCTGQFPPGCTKGQSFVNDPSMTDAVEVKANIKLRFLPKQGNVNVIVRSFQVKKMRNKMEFKALDGVIKTTDESGKKVSLSMKCTELDKDIPTRLGVSRAVLENVIFCHQEDSCWPLSEGAVLKKKFDDIFESTRYSKALEAIKKTKKEYSDRAKDIKVQVAKSNTLKSVAVGLRKELLSATEREEELNNELAKIDTEIETRQDNLKEVKEKLGEAQLASAGLENLRRDYEELERRISDKEEALDRVLLEDDIELEGQLEHREKELASRNKDLREKKRELEGKNEILRTLRQSLEAVTQQKGEVASLKKQAEVANVAFEEAAKSIEKCTIGVPKPGNYNSQEIKKFLDTVQEKVDAEKGKLFAELDATRNEMASKEKVHMANQSAFQEVSLLVDSIEQSRKQIQSDLNSAQSDKRKIAGYPSPDASEAKTRFEAAKKELADFNSTFSEEEKQIREELDEVNGKRQMLNDAKYKDEQLLQHLRRNRTEHERNAVIKKQLEEENESCANSGLELVSSFSSILDTGDPIVEVNREILLDLIDLAEKKQSLSAREVTSTKEKLRGKEDDVAKNEAIIAMDREVITGLQVKLDGFSDAKRDRDNAQELLNTVLAFAQKMDSSTDDDTDFSLEGTEKLLEKIIYYHGWYVAMSEQREGYRLRQEKGMCLACKQNTGFDVVGRFETQLTKGGKSVELLGKTDEFQKYIDQTRTVLSTVRNHQNILDSMSVIEKDLANARKKVAEAHSALDSARKEANGAKMNVEKLEEDYKVAKDCFEKLQALKLQWDNVGLKLSDVNDRQTTSATYASMSDTNDARSLDEIEREQSERTSELDNLLHRRDRAQQTLQDLERKKSTLTSVFMDSRNTMMDHEHKEKELTVVETRITSLKNRSDSETVNLKKARERKNVLDDNSRVSKKDLEEAKLKRTDVENKKDKVVAELDRQFGVLQSKYSRINEVENRLKELGESTILEKHTKINQDISDCENKISEINPKLQTLNSDINAADRTFKNIEDNLIVRTLRKELTVKKQEYEKRTKKNSADLHMKVEDAEREIQRTSQGIQSRQRERAMYVGRNEEIAKQKSDLRKRLSGSDYKDIDEQCRRDNIKFETTMLAVQDLDTYYHALDNAMLNFHSLRIKEVNKIIKEMWQLTYRGEDVENIEIVSGEEGASNKAMRSYNYRVVMRKGEVPLEMRGRCSAGQRMLASIVIRLALAETFCLNCGILTLDEPTTNLDDSNKKGLASALARIISARTSQSSFQLICITHDEDFVNVMRDEMSALANYAAPEFYFRISRQEDPSNQKYFSRIERIPWEDM